MPTHATATPEKWLAARLALLQEEKEVTRRMDEVAQRRQELPWVQVTKDYRFDTEDGPEPLSGLFRGRSQLLVFHFMFGPDFQAGCPSCSCFADGFNGVFVHLANHDVTLWAISRGPLPKLLDYRRRMGWSFPWASSQGTDFNFDFNVSFSAERQQNGAMTYNYEPLSRAIDELPGVSAFVMEDGMAYHTYSTYARGLDGMWNMYQWLDRAPKGRNEPTRWVRRHDEYATA